MVISKSGKSQNKVGVAEEMGSKNDTVLSKWNWVGLKANKSINRSSCLTTLS